MKRLAFATILVAASANAHSYVAGRGVLVLEHDRGSLRLTLSAHALERFDDDGDDRLSAAEIDRHREAIDAYVDARVGVTPRAAVVLRDTLVAGENVTILRHYRWKTAPASVKVRCDLKASIDVVR